MMEWKPIETAPKDGTKILTWRECKEGSLGSITVSEWGRTGYGEHWRPSPMAIRIAPTHWMPLPEPPDA